MSERLIVRNFGPLKDVDLDIRSTMVFIGPQSSGKSTIAKLLAIFRDIEFVIDGYQEDNKVQFFLSFNIANYFQEETYLEYSNKDYKIILNDNLWVIDKSFEFENVIIQEKQRIMELIRGVVDTNERLKSGPDQKENLIKQIYDINWRRLFIYHREQTYIPAERILTSIISDAAFSFNDISLPGALKQFGREFERAKVSHPKADIPFLNIRYQYEEKDANKGFRIFLDGTKSVSLNESSSGIQSILPLHIVINALTSDNGSKHSFIVEEPELNLFPSTQKATISFLIEKANHKNELLITTHSPYVLSVLNNLLFAFTVAQKGEKYALAAKQIIPENIWIDPKSFSAYYIADGTAANLINDKTKLIKDNFLDSVSEDIVGERDALIELYKNINAKIS